MRANTPPEIPSLSLDLGETADMLRESVRKFAADEIAPRVVRGNPIRRDTDARAQDKHR